MTVSKKHSTVRKKAAPQAAPSRAAAEVDPKQVDMDILQDVLSFYVRSLNLSLSRDLDSLMGDLPVARGTGKISTLLLVAANPGIRPSTIAEIIHKDRSAIVRLLDTLKASGLLIQRVSPRERRSHELYLTKKGQALAERVRRIALEQDKRFFSVLSAKERAQLRSILTRLYAHHLGQPR